MKKFINLAFAFMLTMTAVNAASIERAISDSNINKGAVSVSVKDIETGKSVYQLNSDKPVNPASTLKALTLAAVLDELGENYEFTTALYKNTNNELILKLGADPFLKSKDLRKLFNTAKSKNIIEPKAVKIDDSIIDKTEWGEGWQWDDDLNPLMPKFSAYNIDKNLLTVSVEPTVKGAPADIKLSTFYPVTFMNLVTTGNDIDVKLNRNNSIAPDVLTLEGIVSKKIEISFPVNYPKRYFIMRLEDAIRSEKIEYYGNFEPTKLPTKNVYLVEKINTPMSTAVEAIMKNSNNMVAETAFKIAGGHYKKTTGSAEDGVEMFYDYCKKLGVNTDKIRIVDGSGVSKNDLVTADFVTDFLIAENKKSEKYKDLFASAGQGTLQNRMLYFGDKLKAKTGTHCDVSSIAGYITTVKGKTYAFDIMINDPKVKQSDKKMLEEYILRAINTSY